MRLFSMQEFKGWQIRLRYVVPGLLLFCGVMPVRNVAQAEGCPELRIVFARGSGSERWIDQNYLEFKRVIKEKLDTVELSYEFIDLDYPAVGVGLDKLGVTVGALLGGGDAYEFGESIDAGVQNLTAMVNDGACSQTKYVIGGYSQGAMVVSRAAARLKANRVIYAATFGDPKIYLPEGEGLIPAACKGENLSDYRMYVPDCQAYKGMLGANIPYQPAGLIGKMGTWCNKKDVFCSSHLNIGDHLAYIADDLYEDASRVIFDKTTKAFGLKNRITSPHDTAILIDSTWSMSSMIEQYKEEAHRLAKETLDSGGRVALYDYRDLDDPYQPVQYCSFEDCTLDKFVDSLDRIEVDGGGDEPESLLSGSLKVMRDLEWKRGATKSLVVLTDAGFLSPDRDGATFAQVVALSKKIDPMNFYIITEPANYEHYQELALATGGKVVTNLNELSLLTDYIMERYDSLPRVEEDDTGASEEVPTLKVTKVEMEDDTARVQFTSTGKSVLVVLNEAVLGVVDGEEVMMTGLNQAASDHLTLIPMSEDVKGDGVTIVLGQDGSGFEDGSVDRGRIRDGSVDKNGDRFNYGSGMVMEAKREDVLPIVPKVPNTGMPRAQK